MWVDTDEVKLCATSIEKFAIVSNLEAGVSFGIFPTPRQVISL